MMYVENEWLPVRDVTYNYISGGFPYLCELAGKYIELNIEVHDRRKFRSQTSDNMDR